MTKRKGEGFSGFCHAVQILRIPNRKYGMLAIRKILARIHNPFQLVNGISIAGRPSSPLLSVNHGQFSVCFRKFRICGYFFNKFRLCQLRQFSLIGFFCVYFIRIIVPNMHIIIHQIFYVGLSAQKPIQFVQNPFPIHFFGGKQGKTLT